MNNETILTTKELAEKLKVTGQHIVNMRNYGGLSFYKVGRAYRYKWEHVENWLQDKEK